MGAGILPCTIHNNKLYFLFGKENKYADTPGWSDFGGGKDNNETPIQTALREGTEEFTGFLGDEKDIKKLLKAGVYKIEFNPGSSSGSIYTMHIFPMEYDAKLPMYYNNNQRFLQKKMSTKLMKESKVFEKSEIKWMSLDDICKHKTKFRKYFKKACYLLYNEKKRIEEFIRKRLGKTISTTRTRKSITKPKTRTRKLR
jgi:hypothetical protein